MINDIKNKLLTKVAIQVIAMTAFSSVQQRRNHPQAKGGLSMFTIAIATCGSP
ncbi:MAG: hypothetical protein WBM86_22505 [Waterburya sp.]